MACANLSSACRETTLDPKHRTQWQRRALPGTALSRQVLCSDLKLKGAPFRVRRWHVRMLLLLGGRDIQSCNTAVSVVEGREVTTIEGVGRQYEARLPCEPAR